MAGDAPSTPGLISPLEATVQAGIATTVEHRPSTVTEPVNRPVGGVVATSTVRRPVQKLLNAQIQDIVTAGSDRRLGPNNSTKISDCGVGRKALVQRLGSTSGLLISQIIFTPHALQGQGVIKRGDEITVKQEPADDTRLPRARAHRESELDNHQSKERPYIPDNGEPVNGRLLVAKPVTTGNGKKTPPTAKRRALQPRDEFIADKPDVPMRAYRTGEGNTQNGTQGSSSMAIEAQVPPTKRKADAMQETNQARRRNTARFIRSLNKCSDSQKSDAFLTCSLCQKKSPKQPYATCGLHFYCKQCFGKMSQAAFRAGHDAMKCFKCYGLTTKDHTREGVVTPLAFMKTHPTGGKSKRLKAHPTPTRDTRKLLTYAYVGPIQFVANAGLPADIGRRGYPRLIRTEGSTKETNTDNLTMAGFVATILFYHNIQTLGAFFNEKKYPKFSFMKRDPEKAQDFEIERECKDAGLIVTCGYGPGSSFEKFEYLVEADGRWAPKSFKRYRISTTIDKAVIERMAGRFGKDLLCGKVRIVRIDGLER